jgi:hypothetical protein
MDPIDSDTQQVIEHYIFDNDTVQYIEGTEFTDDNDTLQTIVEIVTVDSDTRQDIFELDTPFNDLHDTYQLIDNNNAEIFADTVQNIGAVFDLIFDTLQNIVETNPLAGNRRTNKNWEFLT